MFVRRGGFPPKHRLAVYFRREAEVGVRGLVEVTEWQNGETFWETLDQRGTGTDETSSLF